MKFFILALLIGLGAIAKSQNPIPKDAKYLGKWRFDGDSGDAPEIFDDIPQYELFFVAGDEYSHISFPAHDELGYPQPHYFQAKVEGDVMSGETSHWPGGTILEGEDFSFQFIFKRAKIDIFKLKWKGKWYAYRRV